MNMRLTLSVPDAIKQAAEVHQQDLILFSLGAAYERGRAVLA